MCSGRRGAGHRGHWRCDLAQLWLTVPLTASPALHIPHSNSAVRNCTTFRISSFSTDSCYLLLPVSNESFGTKPVKTGKGYASGDLGKQIATFRELKPSFSCDSLCSRSGKAAPQGTQQDSSEHCTWHLHITPKSTFALSLSTSSKEPTLLTLIWKQCNERTCELQMKILVDYSVIQQ